MYLVFGPSEASLIHPRGVVEKRQLYIDFKKKEPVEKHKQTVIIGQGMNTMYMALSMMRSKMF